MVSAQEIKKVYSGAHSYGENFTRDLYISELKRKIDREKLEKAKNNFTNSEFFNSSYNDEGSIIAGAVAYGFLSDFRLETPWHPKPFLDQEFVSFPFQHKYTVLYTGTYRNLFYRRKDKPDAHEVLDKSVIEGRGGLANPESIIQQGKLIASNDRMTAHGSSFAKADLEAHKKGDMITKWSNGIFLSFYGWAGEYGDITLELLLETGENLAFLFKLDNSMTNLEQIQEEYGRPVNFLQEAKNAGGGEDIAFIYDQAIPIEQIVGVSGEITGGDFVPYKQYIEKLKDEVEHDIPEGSSEVKKRAEDKFRRWREIYTFFTKKNTPKHKPSTLVGMIEHGILGWLSRAYIYKTGKLPEGLSKMKTDLRDAFTERAKTRKLFNHPHQEIFGYGRKRRQEFIEESFKNLKSIEDNQENPKEVRREDIERCLQKIQKNMERYNREIEELHKLLGCENGTDTWEIDSKGDLSRLQINLTKHGRLDLPKVIAALNDFIRKLEAELENGHPEALFENEELLEEEEYLIEKLCELPELSHDENNSQIWEFLTNGKLADPPKP